MTESEPRISMAQERQFLAATVFGDFDAMEKAAETLPDEVLSRLLLVLFDHLVRARFEASRAEGTLHKDIAGWTSDHWTELRDVAPRWQIEAMLTLPVDGARWSQGVNSAALAEIIARLTPELLADPAFVVPFDETTIDDLVRSGESMVFVIPDPADVALAEPRGDRDA